MKRRQQNMTTLELLKLGACLLLLAIADGCARPGSGPVVDEQNDMFVSVVPQGFQTRASQSAGSPNTLPNTLAECEKSLKLAACETNAGTSEIADDYSNIQCTSNSLTYVPALLKIAQEMPEKLRPLFCNVERIFISDSITSTAFASPILDDAGVFQGGFIGARKSTFLQTPEHP